MNTFVGTLIFSAFVFVAFLGLQMKYFFETKRYRRLFNDFFLKNSEYMTFHKQIGDDVITQLSRVGIEGSDLNALIDEINHYVAKTKGTTDFSVIQNKVERKLNMRYDQSVAKLAFPTYLG